MTYAHPPPKGDLVEVPLPGADSGRRPDVERASNAERENASAVASRLDSDRTCCCEAIRGGKPSTAGSYENQQAVCVACGTEGTFRISTIRRNISCLCEKRGSGQDIR
jgi:hypothetical protein